VPGDGHSVESWVLLGCLESNIYKLADTPREVMDTPWGTRCSQVVWKLTLYFSGNSTRCCGHSAGLLKEVFGYSAMQSNQDFGFVDTVIFTDTPSNGRHNLCS
jgi:hypothetical protein